jgi:hypothetical protein
MLKDALEKEIHGWFSKERNNNKRIIDKLSPN